MIRKGPVYQASGGYPPASYQSPQQLQSNFNGPGHQHQGPASQQHPQQQAGGSVNGNTDGQSNSASGAQPEMNLASVLHYLQSEWRRWERDRNEWEIERAEMRARIALLEGQRRSAENLKVDLMRRVKMLEYALRQERTKTVTTVGKPPGIAPARLAALQDEDRASNRDEKEGSGSEGSEDGGERLKANGIHPAAIGKPGSMISLRPTDTVWKNISAVPRDPKSRARSREYLKQCLQEITYLTSPGALNPLPPGAPVTVERPPSPAGSDPLGGGSDASGIPYERPRKNLPEQPPPSLFARESRPSEEQPKPEPDLPNGGAKEEAPPLAPAPAPVLPVLPQPTSVQESVLPPKLSGEDGSGSEALSVETSARPPSSPAPRSMPLPEEPQQDNEGKQILTAIYRPDSKAAWREELRAANEQAEKARAERSSRSPEQSDEEQLASLTLSVEEEVKPDDTLERVWTSRRSLKSHLDIVRAVAFAQGPGIVLASGGDDNTVKVWSVEASSIMSQKSSLRHTEIEPILTLRGHTAAITSIVISSPHSTIFSASLDSTIRLWRLPSASQDPYAPWDPSWSLQVLEGHTDAVWDLCLLPPREVAQPGNNGEKVPDGRLVSASADGTVKVWRLVAAGKWILSVSYDFGGVIPTCLGVCQADFGKVLVGLGNGVLKVWDVEEGSEVQSFGEATEGTEGQVNAVLSHPTLPIIISAHEDGHMRFFDAKSSSPSPTHTILAHPSAITSLTLSPLTPMGVITGSTDCTMRLWDLLRKTSVQDLQGHRMRGGEGVEQVVGHGEVPVLGSAGADGVVRLWGAG